jgi:hypothetical protein
MAADLSQLDLVAIQIEVCMSATTWCWSRPSGSTPTEGATENAAVVQALIDSRARARRLARRGLVWINVTPTRRLNGSRSKLPKHSPGTRRHAI